MPPVEAIYASDSFRQRVEAIAAQHSMRNKS
jgi:hypothetical protein